VCAGVRGFFIYNYSKNTVMDVGSSDVNGLNGEAVEVSRKVQKSGSNHKFYLPKDKREELSLESPETVQVFFHKK